MSLIHPQSCDCMKSELDLFGVPMTQTSVESGRFVEIGPLNPLDRGTIEFKIPGSVSEYLDLSDSYIVVKAKITEADGTACANDVEIAPVNNFLHSLFKQVDLTLGDTVVSASSDTYAYRAYIETLLSYGSEAKESQLTASLWYKDKSGQMAVHANNTGYTKRKALAISSGVMEMVGRLHIDMMHQDRYLLGGVDVKIRLVQNAPAFCLIGAANATQKVQIMDCKLMVRHVKVSSAVQLAHERALEIGNVKYPIRRVECKSYTIPAGQRSSNEDYLFSGQLPNRLVFGMVTNDAYVGSTATNPFDFRHFGVNNITLSVDGHQLPAKPLEPNWTTNEYIQSYMTLFSGTGQMFKDDGNHISREEYKAGYTLWAYDLTPDLDESDHTQLIRQGIVSLKLKFAAALTNSINVIVYGEFENLIEVDKNRRVIADFSS